MGKNNGNNISKKLNNKYSQKIFDHAKIPATDAIKTSSKRVIQKTVKATSDLIGNEIINRITKVPKHSETVTKEHDKEIPKERYASPEERQKIIYEITLKA